MTARKSLKGIKKRPRLTAPQSEQDKVFCERWLIHFDKDRAWREAGYSPKSRPGPNGLLDHFAEYLRPIREAKAKIIAERVAISSEKVLEGMVKKVFFDPTDFYERSTQPLTEWVKKPGAKVKVEQVMLWDGKPIYGERMKPYSDLTPEQQAVVQITSEAGERIQYRMPTISEQHTYFTSIGRQFGMFAEKLILERHNHQHTHQHLTFENVPTVKLLSLTKQLLPLVGVEFAQTLGYSADDVAAASADEGVLMPQKSTA